jgi:cytoskeletal protein CcmA (bactofilin family)
MPIWKEQTAAKREPASALEPAPRAETPLRAESAASYDLPRRAAEADARESVIASDLTIEGKIEGAGHVRLAGRFKGDVNVQGHLTVEPGAKLSGSVRAGTVIVGGEIEGNIDAATRVELLQTGVLLGDLKAGSLTVAAGSRMRGHAEFGWEEKPATSKSTMRLEASAAS